MKKNEEVTGADILEIAGVSKGRVNLVEANVTVRIFVTCNEDLPNSSTVHTWLHVEFRGVWGGEGSLQ